MIRKILPCSIRILLWGLLYYIIDSFSLSYLLDAKGAALAWPPIGIYISAILLTPAKHRPYLIAVIFTADILANLQTGTTIITKFAYALLSCGDAVISSWVLLRFVANPFVFSKVKNFLMYLLYSVVICHGLFSILVSGLTSYTQGSDFWPGIFKSWVADGVGNIMIVPFIVSWMSPSAWDINRFSLKRLVEVVILIGALVASNILLFPYSKNGILFSFIINYLSFPFIIWAILRFDMKMVTLVLVLLSAVMLVNIIDDADLFPHGIMHSRFLIFQLYIASLAVIAILITSIITDRNQAKASLLENIKLLVETERKLVFNSIEIEERERSRYSQELHDGLGPLLSTIKIYIQSLSETRDAEKLKFIGEESQQSIKIAIQTMREVAHGLSPLNLKKYGYVKAVLEFTKGINKLHNLSIDFTYNSNGRFGDFYEIMLYRITTELINNTLKHAMATHVDIGFIYSAENRSITLLYHDNGKGFDISCDEVKNGIGLLNIQQRIKILGGNFRNESVIGQGCTIYMDFLLNEADRCLENQSSLIGSR